jgi:hypothetical protein
VDSDFVTLRCTSCSLVQALGESTSSEAMSLEPAKMLRIEERALDAGAETSDGSQSIR